MFLGLFGDFFGDQRENFFIDVFADLLAEQFSELLFVLFAGATLLTSFAAFSQVFSKSFLPSWEDHLA